MIPRAIFFDLDETLIQHTRSIGVVLKESLLKFVPERAAWLPEFDTALAASGARHWEGVAGCAGEGERLLTAMLSEALADSGFDPALAAYMLKDLLQGITTSTQLTVNALATLDVLRARGVSIGVITNGLTILQTAKVRAHGLDDRVEVVVTSEDAGAHKPSPRIFEMALAKLRVSPTDAWHVGDNPDKDIVGAQNAGMTGILFAPASKRDHGRLDAVAPRLDCPVIGDLRELTQLILA